MPSPGNALLLGARDSASDILKSFAANTTKYFKAVGNEAKIMTKEASSIAKVLVPIANLARLALAGVASFLNIFVKGGLLIKEVWNGVAAILGLIGTLFSILKSILVGIVSILKAVANAVLAVFQTLASAVGSLVGHIHSHLGTIAKYVLGTLAIVGGAFVATALAAEHAWQPVAQILGRLKIGGAGNLLGELRAFALETSRGLIISTKEVLSLAESALHLKVPVDQLKAMTAASIGLASALGISAGEAMDKLANATGPALEKLKALAQQGIDLAGEKVSTFTGLWQQFKNVLANNAQVLGERIAPGIAKIVDAIRPLLGLLESTGNLFAAVFNGIADVLAPILTKLVGWFAAAFAGFVAFGQTVTQNWTATWALVEALFAYYVETIKNILVNFFTVTLPAYFNWFKAFANAWLPVLGEGLKVGFVNLFKNLANVAAIGMSAIVSAIKGDEAIAQLKMNLIGVGWSRSLTEGFKSAITPELPTIADRVATPLEKALAKRAATIGIAFARVFGFNFDKQLEGFNEILNKKGGDKLKNEIGKLKALAGASSGHNNTSTLLESRTLVGPVGGGVSPEVKVLQQIVAIVAGAKQGIEDAAKQKADADRALLGAVQGANVGVLDIN
jgi:hypothetical protein